MLLVDDFAMREDDVRVHVWRCHTLGGRIGNAVALCSKVTFRSMEVANIFVAKHLRCTRGAQGVLP